MKVIQNKHYLTLMCATEIEVFLIVSLHVYKVFFIFMLYNL